MLIWFLAHRVGVSSVFAHVISITRKIESINGVGGTEKSQPEGPRIQWETRLATLTRVSNFVEENVFFVLHRQGSPSRAFSPSLPNMSNVSIAMHSACSKH